MAESTGRGGARPGAGRKKKADKFEAQIAAAEARVADRLPQTIDTLFKLAEGGVEVVEEFYEPAGTIVVDGFEILKDDKGKESVAKVKKPAFPDLKPDTLVLVKRVRSIAAPDRVVNIYLADRIMGKPTERVEHSDDGESGTFAIVRLPAKASIDEWQQQALSHQPGKAAPVSPSPNQEASPAPKAKKAKPARPKAQRKAVLH